MRILILTNAASGKGRSATLANAAQAALNAQDHNTTLVPLAPDWESHAQGAELIVACGGDGTLSAAAPAAARLAIPVYHLPRGTENLFARHFRMRADPDQLLRAAAARRIQRCDLCTCTISAPDAPPSERSFVLMCSVGIDADVLHALAARRRGPISHASYTIPVLASLANPIVRALTIEADGQTVVDRVRGHAIISNCPRYALGIDPSRDASMTDGLLNLFFIPSASRARNLAWAALAISRVGRRAPSIVRARASRLTIRIEGDHPNARNFQLDGEAVSSRSPELTLRALPGALPVLLPD